MGCLYKITFPSGKSYIGISTASAEERFSEHVYNAKRGLGRGICRALRKYGADAAQLATLVIADSWGYLCELEVKAIAAYKTKGPHGYNMTDGGEGSLGYKHTAESLQKMGAAHVGNKYRLGAVLSDESRLKMSLSAKGRKHSAEAKAKIAAAGIGNKYSLGRTLSEHHKRRISEANTGKVITEESRVRMSIAAKKREAEKRARKVADGC